MLLMLKTKGDFSEMIMVTVSSQSLIHTHTSTAPAVGFAVNTNVDQI